MNHVIYITYDKNLKNYLYSNGITDILYGINPKTNKKFWVYERTEYLNNLLSKWFE